jgi:probable HAF family extracellular repeat protein
LGGLPGSTSSIAYGINNSGQIVGTSVFDGFDVATEWSGGGVIDLGSLPGSLGSVALSISNTGQIVGYSQFDPYGPTAPGLTIATEWSGGTGGSIVNLGGLTGSNSSVAYGINDSGQAVGNSVYSPPPTPEPSTWAMMLVGFAGLGYAGYRRTRELRAAV